MLIEFSTSNRSEVYHHVSKISVKGQTIYLYYTDGRTYQEFLDRVPIYSLKFFNVLEEK